MVTTMLKCQSDSRSFSKHDLAQLFPVSLTFYNTHFFHLACRIMYHDKRLSTSSYADSGYFAPSVTSSSAPAKSTSPFNRTLQHTLAFYGPAAERSRASSVQSTRSRRTDEVIACPRPLAFPFHNDSYFLPVAETTHNSPSASNSTRNLVSIPKTETVRRKDPIMDSIKPGTVRSLKVFFQKTAETTTSITNPPPSGGTATSSSSSPHTPTKSVFAGIKQGTVKALQRLFTPSLPKGDPSPGPKPRRTWKWWKRSESQSQEDSVRHERLMSRCTSSIYGDASTPLLQPPSPAAKKSTGRRFLPKLSKPPWLSKPPSIKNSQFEQTSNPISNLWRGLKSIVNRKS